MTNMDTVMVKNDLTLLKFIKDFFWGNEHSASDNEQLK